ncbi:MAG: thiamine-phosphate kinase [Pseudomonadota bacterium]
MDEFGLIDRYFARGQTDSSVRVGIGDDGAVLSPTPGHELVAATDTLIEDVHFPPGVDSYDVGWRSVSVNLSDFAAMGAEPRWMTMALSLRDVDSEWLDGFAAGIFDAAAEAGVSLVGGDTTRGRSLVVTLQVIGEVPVGEAILRSGAKPGDCLYLTGHPGDAAAGLSEFDSDRGNDDSSDTLRRRFLRPQARVGYGFALRGFAHAAIDVSDGLYADLVKLLDASGVGARLELDRLPLSAELKSRYARPQQLQFALAGGDDYELLFTGPAEGVPRAGGLPVTAIGEIVAGSGVDCTDGDTRVDFEHSGYLHFQ